MPPQEQVTGAPRDGDGRPPPLIVRIGLPPFRLLLLLAAGLGCAVMIEPAPSDFLILLALVIYFVSGLWLMRSPTAAALLLGLLALFFHALSLLQAVDFQASALYFAVTAYLFVLWWLAAQGASWWGRPFVSAMLLWTAAGALITTFLGLLAFYQLIPGSEYFLRWQRVKGLFKDANVYGPYLVPPLLFLVHSFRYHAHSLSARTLRLSGIVLLTMGIVFSFSRGALGNLIMAAGFYALLALFTPFTHWIRTLAWWAAGALAALVMATVFLVGVLDSSTGDFFLMRFQMQSYDDNRFGNQFQNLTTALNNPLGMGPGEANEAFDMATHNLYIRLLAENGFPGLAVTCLWGGYLLISALRHWWMEHDAVSRDLRALLIACLFATCLESMIIDTLHWRHFFLLFGLAGTVWAAGSAKGAR